MMKYLYARFTERFLKLFPFGKVIEKAAPQKFYSIFDAAMRDQIVQRPTANNQPACKPIDVRQYGFSSNHIFKSAIHNYSPCLPFDIESKYS
ncbi:hypothetical protein D3C80_1992970 [compost metagenome]